MTARRLSQTQHNSMKRCPQDEIVEALKWLTHSAKLKRVYVVTVFPRKRLRGLASARRYTHARNADVWTSRQIELALTLALSQSFFFVSSETWRQRRGVPIGGMVSKILCSVVMGASETRWTEDEVRRESLGFGGKNDVADLRYVDDTISLTRVYCRDCITMIYPPGIVFEPQPLTGTTSTWLDIDVHLSRDEALSLLQHNVNFPKYKVRVVCVGNMLFTLLLLFVIWTPPFYAA